MQIWSGDGTAAPFAGVVGFTVDGSQVAERGRVSHPSSADPAGTRPCAIEPGSRVACAAPVDHPTPITRSLVIGSTLYTLSEAGLKASNLTDLADVGWLPFG
jgi:beta propeller domain-containing protein